MSFIIIPIKFGYIEEGKFIGWTAHTCNYCKAAQPTCCFDVTHQNTLYGLKVTTARAFSKRLVCSFCNESLDLSPNTSAHINSNWNPEQSFQQLVDTTNPALGFIGNRQKRSLSEINAILRRIEEWTDYSFHNEGNVGCLFGIIAIIAFIIGSMIGSNLPPTESVKNYMIIFSVPFTVFVCLISYFIVKYFLVRKSLLKRLSQAGIEKGIGKDEFTRALARLTKKKKELVWAVNKL